MFNRGWSSVNIQLSQWFKIIKFIISIMSSSKFSLAQKYTGLDKNDL